MVDLDPEREAMAKIERIELEIRDVRRRVEHARNESDKRVLNQQIQELADDLRRLQEQHRSL